MATSPIQRIRPFVLTVILVSAFGFLLPTQDALATFTPVCPPPPSSPHLQGKWTCTFDLGGRAVHMMVLRGNGGSHSQVMWWPDHNDGDDAKIWAWEPGDTVISLGDTTSIMSLQNLLCSGHSFLPDGRAFITGGTDFGNDFGIRDVNILDHHTGDWESTHPDEMQYPRWYPTNTTLGDGRVFISAGLTHDDLFVFGGHDGTSVIDDPAVFAPNTTPEWLSADFAGAGVPSLSGESPDSCLIKAGPINGSWSDESNWGVLSTHLANDPGFGTGIVGCEFGMPLEPGEDTNFLPAVEFFVTDFVKSWLTRTENYGLAVRAIRPDGTEACGRWGKTTTASLRIVAYGSE